VTFDPFGDFATEGYLRNFEKEKDLAIVKRAENASFTTGLDEAFASLVKAKTLSYHDVLKTHGILFGTVYPWAGQDRTQTVPKLTIKKGPVIFANAPEIRAAVDFALRKGQDKHYMKAKSGEIMGYLAYGHPFLDGNGRTIMTVHFRARATCGLQHRLVSNDEECLSRRAHQGNRKPSERSSRRLPEAVHTRSDRV
jgi:cell filamentation protein